MILLLVGIMLFLLKATGMTGEIPTVVGGFITLFFKDLGDEKLETNSNLFRQFINNEMTINNKSFNLSYCGHDL